LDRAGPESATQVLYSDLTLDEFKSLKVKTDATGVQSFNKDDVLYWIKNEPEFGEQAVYLDSIDPTVNPPIPRLSFGELKPLEQEGVKIFAPPMWALLTLNHAGKVIPSGYAIDIKKAGLDIITWTFERADLRQGVSEAGMFDPQGKAIKKDSDMYEALDVRAHKVRILGIFSDWPGTVTYYANCMHF
jgi:glycerophosphoryl diester phosphodiesterase